jgi:hypothetical protein
VGGPEFKPSTKKGRKKGRKEGRKGRTEGGRKEEMQEWHFLIWMK